MYVDISFKPNAELVHLIKHSNATHLHLQVWWRYPQRKFELFLWTQKRWRGHGWHVSHSPRLWQLRNSDGLVLLASNASAEALHLRMPSMRRHEMWRIYPAGHPSGAGTALEQPWNSPRVFRSQVNPMSHVQYVQFQGHHIEENMRTLIPNAFCSIQVGVLPR